MCATKAVTCWSVATTTARAASDETRSPKCDPRRDKAALTQSTRAILPDERSDGTIRGGSTSSEIALERDSRPFAPRPLERHPGISRPPALLAATGAARDLRGELRVAIGAAREFGSARGARPPLTSDGLQLPPATLLPPGGGIRTLLLGGAVSRSADPTRVEAGFIVSGQACAAAMMPTAHARQGSPELPC